MQRLFSGMQPTGDLHLGNLVGALRQWMRFVDEYDAIFCIVDYHAATIEYDIRLMPQRIVSTAIQYIAAGLDPDRCTIFVQSAVPEHTELAWVFDTLVPLGMLERMTQFKDKSQQHAANINAGLFTYPVLQAADILLYKAVAVPVGDDQAQHLELTREIARRFNNRFGETFPEPKTLLGDAPRIIGLDGQNKMSKSLGNHIALSDPAEEIRRKLSVAVTDPARIRRRDPGDPGRCNIFSLHKVFSTVEQQAEIDSACRTAGIGCLDCKMMLYGNVEQVVAPIRERITLLENDRGRVREILAEGGRRCRAMAAATMDEVRGRMGLAW